MNGLLEISRNQMRMPEFLDKKQTWDNSGNVKNLSLFLWLLFPFNKMAWYLWEQLFLMSQLIMRFEKRVKSKKGAIKYKKEDKTP